MIYASLYFIPMDNVELAMSLEDYFAQNEIGYPISNVLAVIPVGARKSGSAVIYPGMFDGTYIRCFAEADAVLYFYILHTV